MKVKNTRLLLKKAPVSVLSLLNTVKDKIDDNSAVAEESSSKADSNKNNRCGSGAGVRTIDSYMRSAYSCNAEIYWCLKVVISKMSLRSCDDLAPLFSVMFKDSNIAKESSLARTKCGY